MRLIDAGKLVNDLYALYEWCQDERKSGLEQAMCIVHDQPTAYDVDKVVEELENSLYDTNTYSRCDELEEIVRRGGKA